MPESTQSVRNQPRVELASERARQRPIIVAMGPERGARALVIGAQLAKRRGVDLVVASVVAPPSITDVGAAQIISLPSTLDSWLERRRELVYSRIHGLRRHHAFSAVVPEPQFEIAYGNPAGCIADIARERDASLIVMGIGKRDAQLRLLSAGMVYETSRRAPCPVLAVSRRARELPRRAVVTTDFSPESIHAAHEGLAVLADGASVHIVHGWTRFATVLPGNDIAKLNDEYAASLPERFARFRAALRHEGGFLFASSAPEGSPADSILAIAKTWNADLIVAGSHGAGALERWVLGSTSNALLQGAECSVLIVPSPGVARRTELTRHMLGTSTVRNADEWDDELHAFASRNSMRRTVLELENQAIGAQVQESGYALVGASYDSHDRHVTLMFGGDAGRPHFSRSIARVSSVSVASRPGHEDQALCVESDEGRAILTFAPAVTSAPGVGST